MFGVCFLFAIRIAVGGKGYPCPRTTVSTTTDDVDVHMTTVVLDQCLSWKLLPASVCVDCIIKPYHHPGHTALVMYLLIILLLAVWLIISWRDWGVQWLLRESWKLGNRIDLYCLLSLLPEVNAITFIECMVFWLQNGDNKYLAIVYTTKSTKTIWNVFWHCPEWDSDYIVLSHTLTSAFLISQEKDL